MLRQHGTVAKVAGSIITSIFALSLATPALAQEPIPNVSNLLIPDTPVTTVVDPALKQATGEVQIVVHLDSAPLSKATTNVTDQSATRLDTQQQDTYVSQLTQVQDTLAGQISSVGGREVTRLTKALNAVVVSVNASQISAIAALPHVRLVRPVRQYEMDLSEVVPYVGATTVQNLGFDGTGVDVAVLDSGIDYTHANLGGAGTIAAYEAAYGTANADPRNTTTDGLFPTEKVVGGYDFVGEVWPNGPTAPDPDPIDYEGHGTHVADIIGGRSTDGTHVGVAPGVNLYAVKVCSAVASSCDGVALLQGIEFALDPDGDNDIDDAVDVINMSLGSSYGQREDDLSEASANAVRAGVVVVVSAGNSADRPYIVGSPSSTPEVISVAQTQVPSARTFALVINTPASIAGVYPNTATVDWAPIGAGFSGDVVYVGRGCNADPYLADPAGKVALIDRGTCSISEKARRASDAGAIGVLIGLIAPGDAVSFSNAGQCPVPPNGTCKPTLVIIKAYADSIKANLSAGVNVTVSEATAIPLVGSVVGSSSRGPSYRNSIKPDIGAPGAAVSAIAGTGTGEEAFSGTSGAAPVVSGAAALLIEAYPKHKPAEIKALLMNTAETNIYTNPAINGGPTGLAPITRIGGGEVRVDKALASKTAAWDEKDKTGSLSFGYVASIGSRTISRKIVVRNYSNVKRTYTITPKFRYADDQASGAVVPKVVNTIQVNARSSKTVTFSLKVNADKLPTWGLNGGLLGGNGSLLQSVEFDGYIEIADSTDNIHVAWQILPHKAADIEASTRTLKLRGKTSRTFELENDAGATAGRVDAFSLLGSSKRIAKSELPQPGDNYAIIDLKSVGARLVDIGDDAFGLQVGINTYGERTQPNYPAEFDIVIDTNRDGTNDYIIYNGELGGFGVTGQNVVYVGNLATGTAAVYFYTDVDFNSANVILTAPLSALGITPDTQINMSVYAFDNYFTGNLTDSITGITYTPGTPRFVASGIPEGGIPVDEEIDVTVTRNVAGDTASPSQTGLLLLYRDARPGKEAEAITVQP